MDPAPLLSSKVVPVELFNLNQMGSADAPSSCGYCDKKQSYSNGFVKESMHPYIYELMAEKGWRRCGTYYYKPQMQKSCCKSWTHRQDVTKFVMKKDQKKTIRKMMKLVYESGQDAKGHKNESMGEKQPEKDKKKQQKMVPEIPLPDQLQMKSIVERILANINSKFEEFFALFKQHVSENQQASTLFSLDNVLSKLKLFASLPNADSQYYCNFVMVLFGSNKKVFNKGFSCGDFVKQVGAWIEEQYNSAQRGPTQFKIKVEKSGYLLFQAPNAGKKGEEKQNSIHATNTQKPNRKKSQGKQEQMIEEKMQQKEEQGSFKAQFVITSSEIKFGQITIKLVPAEVTDESWNLYKEYCEKIHNKPEKSKKSYKEFLCEKALTYLLDVNDKKCEQKFTPSWDREGVIEKPQQVKGKRTKMLGCYHMKYYLWGDLIAVGVVDILPDGLSSVYFFYHPQYKDQRLGVFSSLIEIEYVRWLQLSFPEFKNYYMGFYIQNNHKMSYKGDYEPFQLLCPISFRFVEVDALLKDKIGKIEKKEIESVALIDANKIADMTFNTDIGLYLTQNTKILHQGKNLTLLDLNPRIVGIILGILRDFIQNCGKQLYSKFTFTF